MSKNLRPLFFRCACGELNRFSLNTEEQSCLNCFAIYFNEEFEIFEYLKSNEEELHNEMDN